MASVIGSVGSRVAGAATFRASASAGPPLTGRAAWRSRPRRRIARTICLYVAYGSCPAVLQPGDHARRASAQLLTRRAVAARATPGSLDRNADGRDRAVDVADRHATGVAVGDLGHP